MSDETSGADWELVHRSVRTPRIAVAVAAVVVAIHVVVGVLLRVSDTGVDFRVSDQVGLALIGVVLGGAILTFTRPRIRAGAQGVEIRNLLGVKVFDWDMVEDLVPGQGSLGPPRAARLRERPGDGDPGRGRCARRRGDGTLPRAARALPRRRPLLTPRRVGVSGRPLGGRARRVGGFSGPRNRNRPTNVCNRPVDGV